jgi:hypothetical protein
MPAISVLSPVISVLYPAISVLSPAISVISPVISCHLRLSPCYLRAASTPTAVSSFAPSSPESTPLRPASLSLSPSLSLLSLSLSLSLSLPLSLSHLYHGVYFPLLLRLELRRLLLVKHRGQKHRSNAVVKRAQPPVAGRRQEAAPCCRSWCVGRRADALR